MTGHPMMWMVLAGGVAMVAACCLSAAGAEKHLPIKGEVFEVKGHTAFLILPEHIEPSQPLPWVWYAPTLPRLPGPEEKWMFERFTAKGIAVAGVDVGESYGSPNGVAVYEALYEQLVKQRGMSAKPALLARSRGGLMLYNWAVEHADNVGCMAGIYPVCNLASYPGLAKACGAYELTEQELRDRLTQYNPIDRLAALAKAQVPIFHIHGDRDSVVPLADNSAIVKQRYEALGGPMTLEVIAGGGHDMKRHWFESRTLVDFVVEHVARRREQ